MLKPDSLRAAIVAAVPALAEDPDRLIMWIDRGGVASPCTDSFNFTYTYRLNILLLEFTGHQALVSIAILNWLRVQQPDLLHPGKNAFDFDADFLDNRSVDIQIELQLREGVRTVRRPDGGFDMQFIKERDPLFDYDRPIGEQETTPPLEQIWFGGERLLPDAPLP